MKATSSNVAAEVVPLSLSQRGLWFLYQLRPESSAYNLATAARVLTDQSVAEIRAYFQGMVDRHPALRTTFRLEGDDLVQVIADEAEVAFEDVDAAGWTEDELRAGIQEAAWRPFDLERGPVFRVVLFRKGADRRIVVAMHHIVADFGSLALLNPREEDRSYEEFVAWQAEMLAGPEGEQLWDYWRQQLAGLPELDLPADRVRPENAPPRGGASWREVEPATVSALKALARSRRATLYVALLTAFHALLHRFTGQDDFAVGSPAAGRPRGFTRTFGYFTNPLVLRADLGGDPSFRELLDRTRQTVVDGLDHQHFPLSLLVERLRPGSELFRTMFVLHQGPDGLVSLVLGEGGGHLPLAGGIELESLPLPRRAAQFDITLGAGDRRGSLGLELVYDAARFDATTAARWLESLTQLLAGAAADPDRPVSELPLLSPGELQQVLVDVNDRGGDPGLPWSTLHEGFERQAEKTPQAVALIDGNLRLTYEELNARASALTEHLRGLGVEPESVVGVRQPRTAELIVSLLGVLKAGGAYLPLDPSYPEERIAFMAADAGAAVILEAENPLPNPPPLRGRGRHHTSQDSRSLAYLIYTSGSTGRPKGVAIEHAAAVRLVAWAGQAFSADELRGVLAATSVSFDLSVFEIFVPLSHGGAVILAENALALPSLPARGEVTLINTVPSALAGLLDLGGGGLPDSVRTVCLAGEPLRRALADPILATGVKLWDLYGPSEDTTYSTGAVIEAGDPSEPAIGWPVAGSRAYVLDRGLGPLPLGIPGELCLGGGGLARGYLGRPELTAERFIPDPYGGEPGGRLYRTGDLVRRRADGALEYLGRLDHQVKIRGFRIELGEVEAALLALPWIREAVVVARESVLAAYVSLAGDEVPADPREALREALRDRLPAPFVPSHFVILDALPRTPNGKVDRKALPAPDLDGLGAVSPPVGPVEEALAGIWADLLGRSDGGLTLGREDRFFDLGGHSLLAARVLARVRETLGAEVPLDAFFQDPTLAGLARRIEESQGGAATPIPPAPRDLPLPLSFAQQRFWFRDRLEPGRATYNVPLALHFQGPLDTGALAGALAEIVRRHEALRTTYEPGDEPLQRIGPPPAAFLLPCADLTGLPADLAAVEDQRLVLAEARRPFDLVHGPVVRGLLIRRGREDHRLVLNLHHIACDGWSLGILLANLSALLAGTPAAEPPLQYADFAVWQRRQPVPAELLADWRERLADAPVLELPVDHPEPPRRTGRGTVLPRLLPADLAAALATAARSRGATLFMALLAGFDALLHRHTGQTDLVVGTVVAGRGRAELEPVVGCFVNTLALRVDLASTRTFADLLATTRSTALAAFRDQALPFERLVEEIRFDRDTSGRPFPRALVVLQNEPLAPPVLPGLSVEVEPVDTGTARADLAISFHDVPGGLRATIELALDVFEEATVGRLWERFQILLAAAAADPSLPLSDLPLLSEAERLQLASWGQARTAPDPATALQLFEEQAARTPDALALLDRTTAEQPVTFAELNRTADHLAARLHALGVGPGRIVGLCVERSAAMVAGLLAIWKAGGAYLPLDPAYPRARLAFLIEDALGEEPVVVTSSKLQDRLVECASRLRAVFVEEAEGQPGLQGQQGPRPEDPAYVIYTSGTTGVPKGVVVEHRQLAALLGAVQRAFAFAPADRMPCVAPFSFDIFLFELLAPLLAGGTSVLVGLRPSLDVDALVGGIGEMTRLHAVPALMRQICDSARATGPWPRMRSLFVGGDRVPADLLDDLRPVFPNAEVQVLYGPTEATILATHHAARPGETGSPIGHPFDHAEIAVTDDDGRPVPIGVPGEIRIGGAGVARGYLGRPDLDAEKFPAPDGRRVYRSGDLGRWRPDGTLEFLGRADDQVKVRGFRIESGEVEAALGRQPGVSAAAVLALEGRLATFVVLEAERGTTSADLQEALRAELPEYMVPDAWRFLPELPLTAHGKVNRRALAALGLAALETPATEVEAPRGPVEETLAAIFADVLGRERVGRLESFFDLGGHSLLAMRVISRARAALGVEIPLAALFDAPTVAGVAAAVHNAEGRNLPIPPLERLGEVEDAPLSFSQQRLWFLDRLEPGTATYNLPVGLRLRGGLDLTALEGTLGEIVHRHQALRTTFHEGESGPVQRVEQEKRFSLAVADLSPLDAEAEAAAFARMADEAVRPFDLEAGPLFRALLLRIAPGDHLLVANLHHIVSDGWSMGVLVREMSAIYHAHHEGRPSGLPELPIQYADWARWQRRWLAGEALETALDWWREALTGLPERLDLPTDHPRLSAENRRGGRRPVRLGRELTTDLKALARREGATLFMTVLAGFQAVLGHQAGQDDLAVGSPVAGRTRVEAEGLIGFFANTLVLRAHLHGGASGGLDGHELLRRTRRTVLAADEHQHLPFEKLVEDLAPARELGRTPLFEAVITFEDVALEPPDLPGVDVELVPVDTHTAKFDLVLDLAERDGELSGSFEYDADLFDAVTVDRLAARFTALLRGLAATPGVPVADLPLLPDAQRHQLTLEWNERALAPLPWHRLEEGFEQQAARTPDAVALVWRDERISYRELNERADALAHRLRDAGAGPETVVGVALPRTPELIVSLFAILKAGAAYVPLDPFYPAERIAFMVEDTRAALRIEPGLRIERGHSADSDRPALPGRGGAENLAYLIYTSGSTGRPKGIAIEHASALWLVAWGGQTFSPEELRGVLGSTSMSFDMSIFEVFVTLSFGGTLILADDALALAGLPAAGEVTLINTVPSAIAALLDMGPLPPSVRTVNLGGEPLRWPLVERVLAAGVGRVWNLYGPSEDTTYSTGDEMLPGAVEVDIGRPVAGSRVYVTDRELRLQPLGVPGEVYLGGHGVSRGYFGRPALTAERYVPDPFAGTPGARLYRTGDRARWHADGKLEYLGRLDRQVKIRGFRIEPGEIEAVLLGHPEVREAAILPRDGALVAYLIAPDVSAPDLRSWLQERLPPALVPSLFVVLESLPLSPNGKIDRAALARLPLSSLGEADESEAEPPQGSVEEALAAIWSEVLGQERIGRHDSFFDLGGHSLLAAQAVSRVRQAFGVEIALRDLFEEPTVAALAARIAPAAGTEIEEPLAGIAGDGPAPLSFAQQRLWFLAQLDPASTVYNLPAVVRLRGDLDVAALERSLTELVRRQESLRTRFPLAEGEPVQSVEDAPSFPLPYLDLVPLGSAAEAEARQLLAHEAAQPFDLQHGPVFRALLLRLGEREHQLLVTMHHIVSDGWSLGVFTRELAALYGPQGGQPPPELPVRYRDFAVWQRARLSGEALQSSLGFWRQELAGLPPGIDLPVDRPRPAVQTYAGAIRPFTLNPDITGRLRELALDEGATLFQVLLAAFQTLLARWSGQEDLAVGTPIAGRNRVELEGLIGFFVNTLVLRGDLSGEPAFRTLVRRSRERFLAAQAHQDLPFEKLVEELRPERNLSRPPLFQIMLVLQNAPREPLALPGLEVVPEALDTGTAKFEIQLTLEETDDGGLTGALDYNRDLYDAATMDRFLGHFATLLGSVGPDPDGRALEAEILTPRERRQILRDWNPSQRFPRRKAVHELFAEQAARRPDAVAVVSGDERLTYGELDRQSNALARCLRRLGVGPEQRVAICLERSAGMIVGILGVLKAGGAYVPIDPEHPAERQALVLEDAEARVLLTQTDLANRLAPREDLPTVLWDVEKDAIAREDGSPLRGAEDPGVGPDNAQYVLYTSGSTGRPKGVIIPHSNVTRLLTATEPWFHFGPSDVWTLFFSFAFDFSVWELWGPLAYGGRLVIVPYWVSRTPAAMYDLIASERVTVLNQTPSAFRQIVQAEGDLPAPRDLALRWVIFGGEALDPAILGPWFERRGDQTPQMINMYGITETTVHVTWRRMTAADVPRAPLSPVGVPIPDLQLYILDPRQLPVAAGVPGEICVGGDGLARGYLRRSDLTAERFVPDPFGDQPGGRLYRSGDRARFLPSGDVEHLGRIDFQVKIRGFRIELGEIEAALAAAPGIRDAVVLARGERSEDRRLIAWVVPSAGEIQVDDLRGFLRGRLPEYMVPSSFVALDALPLTANGKLDRRALPDPEARTADAVLPRNATEEIIAAAWREALGVEAVGVEDSFFDVGGHSLLVVQVHRKLAPHFPGLAVMDLFLHPTISGLAGHLSKQNVEPMPTQEETRERAEDRTDRTRRQRELRRQTRGR